MLTFVYFSNAFTYIEKAVSNALAWRVHINRWSQVMLEAKEDNDMSQSSKEASKTWDAAEQLTKPFNFLTAAAAPISTLLPIPPPGPSTWSSIPSTVDQSIQQLAVEMQLRRRGRTSKKRKKA